MKRDFKEKYIQVIWQCIDEIRGVLPASEQFQYILMLLFLKRISDLYDEARENGHKVMLVVPESLRWVEIKKTSQDLGEKLNSCFKELEVANDFLPEGIFSEIDFNRLIAEDKSDVRLRRLIFQISELDLSNKTLGGQEEFNAFLEELLEIMSEGPLRNESGYLFTELNLRKLIIDLVEPEENMSVYEPFARIGYILREFAQRSYCKLYGNEMSRLLWSLCHIYLLLTGTKEAEIINTNPIKTPLLEEGRLARFDRIATVPPWGWKSSFIESDEYGRFIYGKSLNNMDFLVIQHVLASLNDEGKAAMVLTYGPLIRGGVEEKIRNRILQDDLVEAVIGLPNNVFNNISLATAIVVFNKNKPENRRYKALFIDASECFEKRKRRMYLTKEGRNKIVKVYKEFRKESGFSNVVDVRDIVVSSKPLNVSLYIEKEEKDEKIDFGAVFEKLSEWQTVADKYATKIDALLKQLNK
ncbi:type I restriction enzyme M protein (plasmid) [Carboxydocella thermautotrophica]|nr:type I restriction enzyme M protein [Carboxydocella thermautotrophica]